MKYYFDELSPTRFQALINALLFARYGENLRLTPLRGSDGGRDGEIAPNNPFMPFLVELPQESLTNKNEQIAFRPGRYMFQVKHHDTSSTRISDLRNTVVKEFEEELEQNVINKKDNGRVNYFYLITNVSSSEASLEKIDEKRNKLLKTISYLHSDIWWEETVSTLLDITPQVWVSFPELFPAKQVPLLGHLVVGVEAPLARTVRVFLNKQLQHDKYVKFRQVGIEHDLEQLFIDLDIDYSKLSISARFLISELPNLMGYGSHGSISKEEFASSYNLGKLRPDERQSLISLLMSEARVEKANANLDRIILEGGPGQGKSTITQMIAQNYRKALLQNNVDPAKSNIEILRIPFRIELREFAEFIDHNPSKSLEEFLAEIMKIDTGGREITVIDFQTIVERSPILLICDGLDEIGNDDLRSAILQKVNECTNRLTGDFGSSLRVIITTRPPALAGHHEYLQDYLRLTIAPLDNAKISEYTNKWLSVQINDTDEKRKIRALFDKRLKDKHVNALATNPMQLSILLHLIRIKTEAFPNNRAQLYKSYFEKVIDRDVEKSVGISEDVRDIVESLHKFLGYKIHAATEVKKSDGTLPRKELLNMVRAWLSSRGNDTKLANEMFRLSQERLGLIVIVRGDGEDAQYGFEIQPVREYFAAAFINDEIRGEVEPIFRQMITRTFWREVALFLGGLRRAREKAQLIVEAKAVDNSTESGWLQNGRGIIFQLLQEGVFSQPPELYQFALDFVAEALDPQLTYKQRELENYVETLSTLINQSTSYNNTTRKHVLNLLKLNRDTDDQYSLERIYRVASKVSDFQSVVSIFKSYTSDDIDQVAFVNVALPLLYGPINQSELTIPKLPQDIIARWWWYAANRKQVVQRIKLPDGLHQLLLEELALRPTWDTHNLIPYPNIYSVVWHLNFAVGFLMLAERGRLSLPQAVQNKIKEYLLNIQQNEMDYSGLTTSTAKVANVLIRFLFESLYVIAINDNNIELTAEKFPEIFNNVDELVEILRYPHLDRWIARFGVNVIRRFWTRFIRGNRPFGIKRKDIRAEEESVSRLIASIDRLDSEFKFSSIYMLPLLTEHWRGVNDAQERSISLNDALELEIRNNLPEEFSWLTRLPMPMHLLSDLISRFSGDLKPLLKWLGGKHDFQEMEMYPALHVSVQKSIIKHVSGTEDSAILRGALVALTSSFYYNVAGVNNILKMLAASKNTIFSSTFFDTISRLRVRSQVGYRDVSIFHKVASGILDEPELYGLALTVAAAEFINETSPQLIPPLIEKEEDLQISI